MPGVPFEGIRYRGGAGSAARLVVLLTAIVGLACQAGVDTGPPRDVLLITIDTARADRFSYLGASPVETVAVDSIALDGVAFVNAVTPVPITLPAHASLMTGREPPAHGVRSNGLSRLADTQETLAEVLKTAGYRCAAFVGAAVLEARYGLDQGFDHYDDAVDPEDRSSQLGFAQRRAQQVVDAALAWLDGAPEPTFVWVHLFDPHAPYRPPEPEASIYASAYDGEIAYTDRMVGRLLDGYRQRGRYDRALVVVTADHGESLGEHGEATHGMFVYDATMRIPLVMRSPNLPRGRRVDGQVRLTDVLPTVTELLGIATPADVDGASVRPLVDGEENEPRVAYLETLYPRLHHGWAESRALRMQRWKLIDGAERELYDLAQDPHENDDRAAAEPDRTEEMLAELDAVTAAMSPVEATAVQLDAQARRSLVALGYVGLSSVSATGALPSPRDRIHLLGEMSGAIERFHVGERQEAIAQAGAVVAEEPTNAWFLRQLAGMYSSDGRLDEAHEAYERALVVAPGDIDSWIALGEVSLGLGRVDEAIVAFERALAIDPDDRRARHNRYGAMLHSGREAEAAAEALAVLADDETDAEALWVQYRIEHADASPDERVRVLEAALARVSDDSTLSLELAVALEQVGQTERAVQLYRDVIGRASYADEAVYRLGRLLVMSGRWQDADRLLGTTTARRTPELLYLISEVRYRYGDIDGSARAVREVVQQQPERADAWRTLASLEMQRNDTGAAIEAFVNVTRLRPDDVASWGQLAQLYEQAGMTEAAGESRAQAELAAGHDH